MEGKKKAARLLFLPVPAMGHLVPMVELAKRILQVPSPGHQLSVTILTIPPREPHPELSSYISAVSSSTPEISFMDLPLQHVDRVVLPGNPGLEAIFCAFIESVKPAIKSTVQELLDASPSVPVTAIVLDMFCAAMIDVANDLGISPYVFFPSSAIYLSLGLSLPIIDATIPPEKDMDELQEEGYKIDLPGFSTPLPPICLPNPFFFRKNLSYSSMVHMGLRLREAKGIIVNTYTELEPDAIKALEEGICIPDNPTPPIYTAGPLLCLELDLPGTEHNECITWLNDQPPASVVFLCFGSVGTTKPDQAKEIAIALERSGLRFLWVLRSPPLTPENEQEKKPSPLPVDGRLEELLPHGFLERTRGMGLVWPKFAPQKQILGHEAVGGFVTHCGWNSCLESLWFGVPMLGWPRYAEQHFNLACMESEMGVAIALKADRKSGNWVAAEEVERGLRCLMEDGYDEKGRKTRARVLHMKGDGVERGKEAVLPT